MHPVTLPFKIKICGVTRVEDALFVANSGADAIGLNFYPQSKRFVDHQQAKAIIESLDLLESDWDSKNNGSPMESLENSPNDASFAPIEPVKRIQRIGVFVNAAPDFILDIAHSLSLDGIQLHGDESIEILEEISRLANIGPSPTRSSQTAKTATTRGAVSGSESVHPYTIRAIRTHPVNDKDHQEESKADELDRVTEEANRWGRAGIDLLLLDAAQAGEFGGTGKRVDWDSTKILQNQIARPIVLAGGLRPDNVLEAIKRSGVGSVDVASGVESEPGKKCPERVRQFVHQALLGMSKR